VRRERKTREIHRVVGILFPTRGNSYTVTSRPNVRSLSRRRSESPQCWYGNSWNDNHMVDSRYYPRWCFYKTIRLCSLSDADIRDRYKQETCISAFFFLEKRTRERERERERERSTGNLHGWFSSGLRAVTKGLTVVGDGRQTNPRRNMIERGPRAVSIPSPIFR